MFKNIFRRSYHLSYRATSPFSTLIVGETKVSIPLDFNAGLDLIDRVDIKFQTDRSLQSDLLKNRGHIENIKKLYIRILRDIVKPNFAKELSTMVEKKLLSALSSSIFELRQHSISIQVSGNTPLPQEDEEATKLIDVRPIGSMKILNVNIDRSKNEYIHKYLIDREDNQVIYSKKPEKAEEEIAITKSQKMRKEILENRKAENELTGWKKNVKIIADKLGFPTDQKAFDLPNPVSAYKKYRNMLLQNVESKEFILVEDYEVVSPFGIILRDMKQNEILESDLKEGNLVRHFLRVEKAHDEKEAPSVWKSKSFIISDIDFQLRGNPHALVKDFTVQA